jgi:hypothetical protein
MLPENIGNIGISKMLGVVKTKIILIPLEIPLIVMTTNPIAIQPNSMNNKNQPAFTKSAFYHPAWGVDHPHEGLTKREYFAGVALQGIMSHPHISKLSNKQFAILSVELADALLEQLDKTENLTQS